MIKLGVGDKVLEYMKYFLTRKMKIILCTLYLYFTPHLNQNLILSKKFPKKNCIQTFNKLPGILILYQNLLKNYFTNFQKHIFLENKRDFFKV